MKKDRIPKGWKLLPLKHVVINFANGGTPSTANKGFWNGTIPWITGADFDGKKVKVRKWITQPALEKSSTQLVLKGDLLLVTRTGIGKMAIAPFDVAISQDITGISFKNNIVSEYGYWYMQRVIDRLKALKQGTSINGIKRKDLESIEFLLPSLNEQEKIAELLTTVDENIEQTDKILDKYSRLKKSMLKKLLTKGFDTKKFKRVEYRKNNYMEIPEHWEWTTLGKHTNPESGSTPSKKILEYYAGTIPWVTTVDLNYGWIMKPTEHITEEAVKSAHLTIHPQGTFLIAITGLEAAGTRGRCGILGIEATTSQSCVAFKTDKKVLPEFLFYWYQCFSHSIVFQLAQGTKQQSLNINLIKDILIALPSVDEQKRIVDVMKQVDQTIAINREKKKHVVKMKKSLMQKLLSGEIRVRAG